MKKILYIFLLILAFPTFVNAANITFDFTPSLSLDENQGQVSLPAFQIDLGAEQTKNLNFSLAEKDYLIFANDVSKVTFESSMVEINTISLDQGNKALKIELKENITGAFQLNGVQIRTYDQEIDAAKVGFDYNNDLVVDAYSTNSIRLDDNDRYDDTMRPLPVYDVVKDLVKNSTGKYDVTFTWKKSPDLDVSGSFVTVNKNKSYGNIIEEFISKIDETKFSSLNMDLEKDSYTIQIFSKDSYYSNSNPYSITLDKNSLQVESVEEETEEEVLEEEVTEEAPDDTEEPIVGLEIYVPVFNKYDILNKVVDVLDAYITKKLGDNEDVDFGNAVIEIRNDLMVLLEELDQSERANRSLIIQNFKTRLLDLKKIFQ